MAEAARSRPPNSLANLRPWTAEDRKYIGQPKHFKLAHFIREQTQDGREMAQRMLSIMRGERQGGLPKGESHVPLKYRLAATDWLANRAFGFPKETIDLSTDGAARTDRLTLLAEMTPEDRLALRTILVRALEAQARAPAPGPVAVNGDAHA